MAQAAGYAVLPISPSLAGFGAELQKQLVGPTTKAGKEAGKAIGDSMQSGVEAAKKAVSGAQYRVKKATEEQKAAESKLREEKDKSRAATLQLEEAAKKRADAESKGADAIAKAEVNLARKRAASERAARSLSAAEEKVEGALTESARAAKSLEDKQEDLTRAQDKSRREAEKYEGVFGKLRKAFKDAARGADDTGGAFGRFSKEARELNKNTSGIKLGAVAGVFASATSSITSSLGGLASEAVTASDATDKFKSTMDFAGLDDGTIEEMTKKTKEYADSTVYDLADIQNMTAQLASNGVENYEGLAEAAGNMNAVAGGNSETFKSVGMVMTQTAGAGKLTTENWNQLADAIPGASGKVQEALEKNGAFTGNFREAMEEGQITADEFNDAVMQIGSDPIAVEASKSTKTFEGMIGNLKATIVGGLSDALNELKPTLEPILQWVSDAAGRTLPLLVDAIKSTVDWTKEAAKWAKENQAWLTPLAVGIGAVALAWGAWTLAVKGYSFAIGIAGKATQAFDKITKGTIWGAIALAVIGVVSALTYFFTQTETGRKAWATFTEALGNGWNWVKDTFTAGWNWIRDVVFTPMANFVTQTLWPAVQSTVQWIGDKWNWMKDIFTNVWNWVRDVVINPFVFFMTQVFWVNVMNTVNWVVDKWNWMKDVFTNAWNWIRDVVINPFVTFMTTVLWPNIMNVVDWIVGKWNWLRDMLTAGWNWIRDNVIQLFINGANNLWNMVSQAVGWIVDKWNWMRDRLNDGWMWIDNNVFSPLKNGLDVVKGWFQTTVDNIGTAWDRIKEKTRVPIEFVVNTVYNNGIRQAWNKVAKFVGMDELAEVKFASGGILPGYTPGRDPYTFVEPSTGMRIGLSGGEAILRPEATRALGAGWVDNVNQAARQGGVNGVKDRLTHSHFANGGILDLGNFAGGGFTNLAGALSAIQKSHGQFVGKFFPGMFSLTSASRSEPGSFHDYSAQAATDWQATDGQFATQMPTPQSKALARAIYKNFRNSAELIHYPLDGWENLDEGSPFNFGAATNAGHGNHVHWATHSPLRFDGDDIVLDDVPAGSGSDGSFIKRLWDGIIDKIPKFDGAGEGIIGGLPAKFLQTVATKAWDFLAEKVKSMFNVFTGGSGEGAERWRDLARQALRRFGYGDEYLDAMVQQIDIESSGNPNSVNNWDSNAAKGTPSGGLLQVIETTYRDMRNRYPAEFEGTPDDRMNPMTNLIAGVAWSKYAYGGPGNVWPTRGGYHNGGLAGFGQGIMKKTAMEPEMVLDPQMTKAFIQWMGVADDVAKAVQPTAAKSANTYLTGQAESVLDIFGLGSVATTAGSWWDKNGEQVTSDALSLYGATQNPDSVATVSAFGQSATFEFNAESLDDVVRVGDLTDALSKIGVKANVKKKPVAVLSRGGAL